MAWPLFDKIVRELGDLGYSGWWAFHHCSEPLLNPRLIREVQHVRALVPQARPAIHTNGDLLTPGLLVDLLCLGAGYLRITRYPAHPDADPSPEPVRQWLLEGGLLDSLPWRFVELSHGWAAVFERDGLRVDVIRPRLPAGAAHAPGGTNLPLSTTRAGSPGSAGCRVTPSSAAIDCSGRVAMCRSVFGDAPACGRHTIGNLRERSFADLWSSPTLSAHLDDDPSPDPGDWPEAAARVTAQGRAVDSHRAGPVVAHEEHGSAALVGVVVLDASAGQVHREPVAVGVDGTAAAAARRARPRRVGATAHRRVVAEHAVEHDPRHADAAQRPAVRAGPAQAGCAAERAADDVHRQALRLAEDAHGGAAEVRPRPVAGVAEEA
jgi:hypothetical protein